MKINWFGRTYYQGVINRKQTFKRPVYRAFRMWFKYDILNKITGFHWHTDSKGHLTIKKYKWNCKGNHLFFGKLK